MKAILIMGKFREFLTSRGFLVLGGKNAKTNEDLIKIVGKEEIVLHTKSPGSPFCNIKENKKNLKKKDIKEAGIFCAAYSRDWKKNKSDVIVHYFYGEDIFKDNSMKEGTFGVKKFKEIKIKKKDIEKFLNTNKNNQGL